MNADALLARFGLHSPPVDVEALARGCGIHLLAVAWADWDAALNMGPPRILYVSASLSATRRRFAVAHALGHHFLHQGRQRAFRERFDQPKFDPAEIQANLFAVEVLVPLHWVRAYHGYETEEQLARRFGVTRALIDLQLGR